jgi:hypothetical protein
MFAACVIFFAIRQLRFDAWLKAQQIVVDDDFRKSRGVVFSYLRPRTAAHSLENKYHFDHVCQHMDELCHLRRFLGTGRVLSSWDDPIGKAWFVLEEWVKKEREITNWPTKWHSFERLGSRALRRLRKRNCLPELMDGKEFPR